MSQSRVSPFAALTGAEKQIKWLEYQSIRLPYIKGSVDAGSEEIARDGTEAEDVGALEMPRALAQRAQASRDVERGRASHAVERVQASRDVEKAQEMRKADEARGSLQPLLREPYGVSGYPASPTARRAREAPKAAAEPLGQTHHRQYDAVIARMRQAERQASTYHPFP